MIGDGCQHLSKSLVDRDDEPGEGSKWPDGLVVDEIGHFKWYQQADPALDAEKDSVRAEETCPFVPIRRPYTRHAVLTLRWFNRKNRSNKLYTRTIQRAVPDCICHLLTHRDRQWFTPVNITDIADYTIRVPRPLRDQQNENHIRTMILSATKI